MFTYKLNKNSKSWNDNKLSIKFASQRITCNNDSGLPTTRDDITDAVDELTNK